MPFVPTGERERKGRRTDSEEEGSTLSLILCWQAALLAAVKARQRGREGCLCAWYSGVQSEGSILKFGKAAYFFRSRERTFLSETSVSHNTCVRRGGFLKISPPKKEWRISSDISAPFSLPALVQPDSDKVFVSASAKERRKKKKVLLRHRAPPHTLWRERERETHWVGDEQRHFLASLRRGEKKGTEGKARIFPIGGQTLQDELSSSPSPSSILGLLPHSRKSCVLRQTRNRGKGEGGTFLIFSPPPLPLCSR